MRAALLVLIGGGTGALCRYVLQSAIIGRFGPSILPLFVINITGAFALGFIYGFGERHTALGPELRLLLTTGFLGGYTTFSSWMFESFGLIASGEYGRAIMNVVGSTLIGFVAVALGVAFGRAMS